MFNFKSLCKNDWFVESASEIVCRAVVTVMDIAYDMVVSHFYWRNGSEIEAATAVILGVHPGLAHG